MTVEETAKYIGADSLSYLSKEGMLSLMGEERDDYCVACFDGNYPVKRYDMDILQTELFDVIKK